MKTKILVPIIILGLAGAFGVWWYVTDILPEKEAKDATSGFPAPGFEDVPEMIVGEGIVEVAVEGDEYSFSPATVTVEQGASVKLTFKNTGNVSHTWTIDSLDLDTGSVAPGRSKTIEFDAVEVGSYKIYCDVSGHEDLGMVGTLNVE